MKKWKATFVGLFICSLAAAQPTTQPAWREKFDAVYELAPDEILKHIQEPFIDERMEFVASAMPDQLAAMGRAPNSMNVVWDGSPHMAGCSFTGDDSGKPFGDLLSTLTRLKTFELVIAPPELARQEVQGDWTLRQGADPVQLLGRCASIVGSETGQNIAVTREIVEEDAIVAKGEVKFDPNSAEMQLNLKLDPIQLRQALCGAGGREAFLDALSASTGFAVIDEAKGAGLLH
jgi:hypothetical protein